jgi:arylsulfatase A-like enzyme
MRCFITLAASVICISSVRGDEPLRPNVVFILADDLGYTDVACYGSKYYETPHIDRLAAEGIRFTDGYACGPNCQPTRAALLSGQYSPRTGVYTVGHIDRFDWRSRPLRPVDNVTALPLEKITIAQTLRKAGYATAMFGKWHLGNGAKYHPLQRGFDKAIVSAGEHFDFQTNPRVQYADGEYLADFLTDRAIAFIKQNREKPFFLYLPHFGVHAPYQAKKELIDRFQSKQAVGAHRDPVYAAMIASVDESVGRIKTILNELGLAEKTLVIFSSDNGGVGGYRSAGLAKGGITDNAPLKGGKGMLAEGGIRVPYIFRWTSTIPPGQTNSTPINSVDLYPTLIDISGAAAPANYPLDGISYASLLSGGRQSLDRDAIFWHFPGYLGAGAGKWRTTPCSAVRCRDWKLLEYFEDGRLELYNLASDLGEKNNLATEQPDKTRELHNKLIAWREAVGALVPTANRVSGTESESPRFRNKRQRARVRAAR